VRGAADTLRVTVRNTPDSSLPQFVFLHGWGASPQAYAGSLRAARTVGLDVVSPTLPGHAHKPLLRKGSRGLVSVADYLTALVRPHLHASRHTVLAGHSLGGALSTLVCSTLHREGRDVSLLLLSPTGASPTFGPREWMRALGDLKEPRIRPSRPTAKEAKKLLSTAVRTGRLGWEARNTDLTSTWVDLAHAGVQVTAVHASQDRVVNTEPILLLDGIAQISIPHSHDWPTWDEEVFLLAVEHHLEQRERRTAQTQ
jgi:pimeloyl-ACP methyl ester carboxylesterase